MLYFQAQNHAELLTLQSHAHSHLWMQCFDLMVLSHARLYLHARIPFFSPCLKPNITEPCILTYLSMVLCMHCIILFLCTVVSKLCTDAIIGAFLLYSSLKRQHMLWLSAYSTVTAPSFILNKFSSLNGTFIHVETPKVYSFLFLMVQRYVSAWPSFYTTVISNFVWSPKFKCKCSIYFFTT